MLATTAAKQLTILLALLCAANAPARAADAEYIGTWGNDAAHCAIPQDQEGAPCVFGPGG